MNAYDILECKQDASQEELKTSYHRLLLIHHPDKQIKQTSGIDKFLFLQSAYKLLSNSTSRLNYDSLLKQTELKQKASQINDNDESMSLLLDKDFEFDSELAMYTRECRCGGFYSIRKVQLNDLLENLLNENEKDTSALLVASLECNTCSLLINVLII